MQDFFPPNVLVDQGIDFHADTYNRDVQLATEMFAFKPESAIAACSITFKGTVYKNGMFLPVKENEDGLVFGKILLIVVDRNKDAYFVTELCQSMYLVALGVHCIVGDNEKHACVCIPAEKLLDYYCLPQYKINDLSLVPLHHAIHCQSLTWSLQLPTCVTAHNG